MKDRFLRLEDAIELVLATAREARGSEAHVALAIDVVEDFFTNNVFDSDEEDQA